MLKAPLISSLVRGAQVRGVGDADTLALKEAAVVDGVGGLFDGDPLLGSAFVDAASTDFTIQTSMANLSVNDTAGHFIDATEAKNVSFTVSGLNPGTIGRVSFTDGDHNQVQVNIDSNGTYSADISTLMGGTITSALLAIDLLTGTNLTASGNPVLLENSVTNAALAINSTADHVINAAESTAVAFTVSGLTAGETGAVTFTDASNHHVVVGVHGNGSYSANLSPLMDGEITSSLSAADATGDSATASGNAVTLDTDSAMKPSLSVDATNPANVTFTVSGLESDYSGTVTFTDASGHQDVVPIESNGAYSANLSNLANGTITYLLSASDPAGNVITVDPPLNLGDGSANAPAGTPQYPHLLDVNSPSTQTYGENYVTRPAWNVAGADYAVGVPAGVTLKDPTPGGVLAAALVAQGCSLSGAEIICNGNNQTISGWDFSLHGGYQLQINGSGDTVANNNFALGANHASVGALIGVGGSAKNTTIVDNTLNGNGLINQSIGLGLIDSDGTGTTTIEYNSIQNAYSENIVIGNNSTSGENLVIQYNLIANGGLGFNGGAHGDWIQIVNGSNSDIINSEAINFNTWMQTVPVAVGRTQGITFPSTGQVLSASYQNNTFIGAPGAYVNYAILIDPSHLNGSATVANNYYDMSGIGSSNGGTTAGWIDVGSLGGTPGPYNGTVNTSNNVNMLTGTLFTQNETSVRQVLTSPSSGTELPGNTITLTVDFSAAVTVAGAPTLTFNDGGTATYSGGSGTNALTFAYTVGASDQSVSALAITQVNLPNGATIKDGSGNAADLSNALTTFFNLAVDPVTPGPTLTSIVESPSTGDLNAGTVTLTIHLSGAVTVVGGTPTLTLNDGGTATYTGGSGTSALTFSYTVGAGQNTASLAATAINLNGATMKDSGGNAANLSLTGLTQSGPQIDTTTPVISSIGETPSSGDLNAGKTVTYTLTMNQAVTVNTTGGSPTLTLNDGGTATYTGGSGTNALTFSYTVLAGQNTPDLMVSSVTLNGATMSDGAGNTANLSLSGLSQGSPQIDTTAPTVSSVVASGTGITAGAGDLAAGKVVTLTVNLSEAVTVAGGTPTLTLNDGGTATYASGSGTNALTFSYTVGASQNTADLAVTGVNLGTATVKDGAGNAADLSGAVTNPAGTLQIDTTAPTVSSVVASGTGIAAGAGDLGVGSVVTLTVNLSEAVTVAGGTPTLTLNDGGTATYTGGSGSNALTFSYTVGAGQSTADLAVTAVNLGTATVKDGAGNAANLAGTVTNPAGTLQISTTGPAVSSVVASGTGITAGAGDLGVGSVVTLTVNLSSAVTVAGGTPTLTLNDGGTATYSGGSGTNALTFNYTIGAGQNTADLAVIAVNLGVATVKDSAGNAANLSGAVTNPAGTLQIDTTTPSVSSVVATGTGITAGAGDLTTGKVVTLTINLSEAVTVSGGTPTLTLNDGGTATYTGGSGSNALTFSYTVGAGQNTADLAVSAFNSNSATITNGVGTAANLTGAATTPAGTLQIDTTTPTLGSITETPSNGHLKAGKSVTLTLNMSEAVTISGGIPTLTLNDGATATYTGGSGTNALTFSYTVVSGQNVNSLAATAINMNGATVKNGAGTAANFTTLSGLTQVGAQIDTTIPTVTQVVASPGSGIENPGDVITLTVDLSKAVTVTGTPTLSLNDGATATYTGGSGTNALTFSYTVAATDSTVPTLAITQANLPAGATILDEAGNAANLSGAVTTFPGLSIDPPPIVVSVAETPSTGDLSVGKTVALTLTLNDVVTVTGGTPTLTLNDGGTATYTGGSGTNALTFTYTVGAGDSTASLAATGLTLNGATVQNSLGNAAIFSFNGVTQTGPQIDTTTPTVTSVAASGAGITAGSGDLPAGSVVTLTVDLSEAVTVAGGTPKLTLNDGGIATYSGGSGTNALTFSYTVGGGQNTSDLAVTAFNLGAATVKDAAGNAANLSGVVTNLSGTLQIDGITTHIAQVGSDYFLDNINGSGPELKYGGGAVTAGEFAGFTQIAAVEVAGGYDVAWKNAATGQYTVWSTDSSGNYTSNIIGAVAGTSTALEGLETTFNQDLNGDGTIGIPKIVIQTNASTALTQVGNSFFLDNTGSGTGPELSYGGAAVTVGEFGTFTPIGAVQVAGGGYDVAWKNTATGQYTVWSTDSSGNYTSNIIGAVAGTSTALEGLETTFNQDLNGDGVIGLPPPPPPVIIQTDGSTSLVQVGSNYFLDPVGGSSGPEMKYGGAAVTVGEFGAFTPIGAVQVAGGGYDVAWKNTATGQYTVWSTDSNGNYLSNVIGAVSGTSTALEALETTFNQDLNGDGTIGIPKVVIQTDGSTSLVQVGSNYFLDPVGGSSGPEMGYGGAAVTVGEFGAFTPIGAVQVAGGGYDVAWKNTATGQYTVWSTDSNGNYLSNVFGAVSGTSTALETLENTFQQDLNGDGVVGIYAAPGTTLQISNPLTGPSGSATVGAGATLELAAANSSSVTFTSSTGALELDQPSTFDGVIFGFTGNGTLSGSDQIDLKGINFNSVHDSYSNGVLTVTDGTNSAALDFNGSYTLANFKFASDGKGGTIVYDPPVTAGQGGSLPPQIMQDPGTSALNQQVALFSQQIAAAFPSSPSGGSATIGAEISSAQLAQIATPIATQQHA